MGPLWWLMLFTLFRDQVEEKMSRCCWLGLVRTFTFVKRKLCFDDNIRIKCTWMFLSSLITFELTVWGFGEILAHILKSAYWFLNSLNQVVFHRLKISLWNCFLFWTLFLLLLSSCSLLVCLCAFMCFEEEWLWKVICLEGGILCFQS